MKILWISKSLETHAKNCLSLYTDTKFCLYQLFSQLDHYWYHLNGAHGSFFFFFPHHFADITFFYHKHSPSQTLPHLNCSFCRLCKINFLCGDKLQASITSFSSLFDFPCVFLHSTFSNWEKSLVKIWRTAFIFCDSIWLHRHEELRLLSDTDLLFSHWQSGLNLPIIDIIPSYQLFYLLACQLHLLETMRFPGMETPLSACFYNIKCILTWLKYGILLK